MISLAELRYIWKEEEIEARIYDARKQEREKAEAEKRELEAKAEAEKIESAKRFLKMGLTVEQVAEGSGLSIEEVNKIKKKIQ